MYFNDAFRTSIENSGYVLKLNVKLIWYYAEIADHFETR